jgi:hypothetical protein
MQTETVSNQADTPSPLQRAETHALTLIDAAEQADDAASKAALAFKADPTSSNFTAAEVAKQRAANAHAALETFSAECLEPLRAARQAEIDAAHRAEVRAVTHDGLIRDQLDRIETAVLTLASEADDALATIARICHRRRQHGIASPGVARLLEELSRQLAPQLARTARSSDGITPPQPHEIHVSLGMPGTALVLSLARPAPIPGHSR